MNNRLFREEDENDVAVMEPPCITKQGKTVYLDDILEVVAGKGGRLADARNLCASGGGSSLRKDDGEKHTTMPQPAVTLSGHEHTTMPQPAATINYVNMEETVQQLRTTEQLDIFSAAERVNRWIVEALDNKRKITVSFKNATDETPWIVSTVIKDIYDRYDEQLIDKLLVIKDLSNYGERVLANVLRRIRLRRDDPQAFTLLEEKILKIAEGNY